MTYRNEILNVTFGTDDAATASTEKALAWEGNDDRLILVINNESTQTTMVVKAGNGIQGVNDETLTVGAGINLVKLDSGRFKNVTGTNKGKIVIKPSAALKVKVVELA